MGFGEEQCDREGETRRRWKRSVEEIAARRSRGGGGARAAAAAPWGRWRCEDGSAPRRGCGGGNGDVLVVGGRSGGCSDGDDSGGGTDTCDGGDDDGWTPYPTFREQPLEMEETPFFSQMTAKVCGGSLPLL